MNSSKVFGEFVSKRCEEILSQDEEYQKFNDAIFNTENEFKKSLSPDQIKDYNRMEELNMESIIYAAVCIYNTCLVDIENVKKIN